MPTDLPKNYSGSGDIRPDRKAVRKAARRLAYQSLWGITKALMLHYGITLAAVAVVAAAGFSDVPRAAVSATALGLLARWFLPNQSRTNAQQLRQPKPQGFEVMELTPEQLDEMLARYSVANPEDGEAPRPHETSPYL